MMKKICLVLAVGLASSSYAQKIKIDLSGGYGNGMTSMSGYSYSERYENGVYTETESATPIALSSGWIGRLGLTAMLNDQMFVSVAGRYQTSGKMKYDLYSEYYSNGSYTAEGTESITFEFNTIEVQAGFGLQRSLGEKMSMSVSAGPSVGVYSRLKVTSQDMYSETDASGTYESSYEGVEVHRPSLQLGAYADLGVSYKLADRLELFGNATLRVKNWSAKSSSRISDKHNGVETIDDDPTYFTETEYEAHVSYNAPPNLDEPRKSLKDWTPASSIEYVLGLRYGLGGAPKTAAESSGTKGIYFSLLGGYGIALGGGTLTNVNFQDYSSKTYSYGSGMNFGLMLGYALKNGVALEVGGMYNRSKNTYFYNFGSSTDYTDEASMIRAQVGVKLEGDGKVVNPFVRAGISTGLSAQITSRSESENFVSERKYSQNLSIGGYGGVGVSIRLSNRFSLIGEALFVAQNWAPGKSVRTKSEYNGVDQLEGLTTSQLETEFVDEVSLSSTDPEPDPNVPSLATKAKLPFSTGTLRIGVRIDLRK